MEEAIDMLESTESLLLGMSMDPRIPAETRDVMRRRAAEISQLLMGFADTDEDDIPA